ncbi:MAG: arsenic resistance N-acetyltransferase ArsN2 [Gemmatimonadetes bacterium]|nr:arsenic resistance N-acetyltransferase ArsN2 [Gemmatimonadota bacterium]
MDGTTIRPATGKDLAAVEALLREAALPTDGVARILALTPGDVVVAVQGESIVGAAAIEVAGADALLRSVVVRSNGRSTGVGRAMVTQLLAEADRRRYEGVYLLTTTAGDWFPRFGFTRVERSSVPRAIAETWEFKTGCADTAVAMARRATGTSAGRRP